jgi:hypothetical protein
MTLPGGGNLPFRLPNLSCASVMKLNTVKGVERGASIRLRVCAIMKVQAREQNFDGGVVLPSLFLNAAGYATCYVVADYERK